MSRYKISSNAKRIAKVGSFVYFLTVSAYTTFVTYKPVQVFLELKTFKIEKTNLDA